MGCVMGDLSAVNLILFVSATFAASFVAGLAGFAFAIVAAAVWLHFLPPAQSTVLIATFGLIRASLFCCICGRPSRLGFSCARVDLPVIVFALLPDC